MGQDNYRFHDHDKLAHYADAAADIEFKFPFGFKELEGIHSRTDFDLSNHEKFSSKKLKYFDSNDNESYIPYVLETSIGVDRMFLAVFSNSLCDEKLEDGSSRTVLKLPAILAPVKVTILPLLKKDGLPEIAKGLVEILKTEYRVSYDEKDAIGRRYRRQDALGTPFCITIDHQSKEDNTFTLRERDSMIQERLNFDEILKKIDSAVSIKSWI
jgi:glycyl-tRNA synthetase